MGLFWWEWYCFIDSRKMCGSYGGKISGDWGGYYFIGMVILHSVRVLGGL